MLATTGKGLHDAQLAVWDRHPDEEYRRSVSHWRGAENWDDESWESSVESTARRIRAALRATGSSLDPESAVAVDFGCGGGVSAAALAPMCGRVYAVDLSEPNVERAADEVRTRPDARATVETIVATAEPADLATRIVEPVDLFVSTATFHTLPDPETAEAVLATAFAVMRPGGTGLVQIRFDDGTPRYRPRWSRGDYGAHHLFSLSWTIPDFWGLLEETGFRSIAVTAMNRSANFAFFAFRK